MAWQKICTLQIFLFTSASSAAVLQQPVFQAGDLGFPYPFANSPAVERLHAAIGDRLITVRPVGAPCYNSSSATDPQCDYYDWTRTNDTWLTDQAGGYFYGNLAACQSEGQTCVLPLNDTTIPSGSECYQDSIPPVMIDMQSRKTMYDDVQAAFAFTRDTKIPLVIKNTGHDWKGRSTGNNSLALWTHKLKHPNIPITLDREWTPTGCKNHPKEIVFHYGPGQQWGDAYEFAHNHSLAIVGGTCPSVGIAGWLQGGGHSPMTPKYGMGVDNVREVEVVTPDNGTATANECQNEDLFFALRGGGPATFGIITSIAYKAIETHEVQDFRFYNLTLRTDEELDAYFELLTSHAVEWSRKGWGGYIKQSLSGQSVELTNPSRTLEEAKDDMKDLLNFIAAPGRNVKYTFKSQASWYHYINETMNPHNFHVGLWSWNTAARLLPKSAFDAGGKRTNLKAAFTKMYKEKLLVWLMLVAPTTSNHTKTSALHPSWSEAVLSVRASDKWDQFFEHSNATLYRSHFVKLHDAFAGIRELAGPDMGISISEADVWEGGFENLFWGEENHKRLLEVKDKVDSGNILSTYQGVKWEPSHDRYKCYPQK